ELGGACPRLLEIGHVRRGTLALGRQLALQPRRALRRLFALRGRCLLDRGGARRDALALAGQLPLELECPGSSLVALLLQGAHPSLCALELVLGSAHPRAELVALGLDGVALRREGAGLCLQGAAGLRQLRL